MKLNNEYIRDILLFLEDCDYYTVNNDNDVVPNPVWFNTICIHFNKHPKHELYYALSNLAQAGFISLSQTHSGNAINCAVNFITFEGHEFLNSIRDDHNWGKIKYGLNALRNYSLAAIQSIAAGVTDAAIQSYIPSISSKNV